jgi:YebC/PmpR family DNA-binding regulatory protein
MAGHSKWANIKHRKAKQDAKKGSLYTKLSRAITVAVKEGGPDPSFNTRLFDAVQMAKDANVPNDNIERAIKRGTGELEGSSYEEIVYEGYGPGGVAIIMDIMTDNRNRTASEIRHLFDKHGGSLGESRCVSWMFDKKGIILIDKASGFKEDDIMLISLDVGAEDMSIDEDYYEISTKPSDFKEVKGRLVERNIPIFSSEVTMVPKTLVEVKDKDTAEKVMKLLDLLDDHDDVQKSYSNFEIDEELIGV